MTLPVHLVAMSPKEQAMWVGLLSSKLLIAHTAPNPDPEQPPTSHVLVRWFNVPGEEQLILYYGNDGTDGFRAVWSDMVKAQEWPEVRAVRVKDNWELHELFNWLGGPADQVAPNLNFHQLYNIPESIDMETLYQQYLARFEKERSAGAIPPHIGCMSRPEFWASYKFVLDWLELDDEAFRSEHVGEAAHHFSKMLISFKDMVEVS